MYRSIYLSCFDGKSVCLITSLFCVWYVDTAVIQIMNMFLVCDRLQFFPQNDMSVCDPTWIDASSVCLVQHTACQNKIHLIIQLIYWTISSKNFIVRSGLSKISFVGIKPQLMNFTECLNRDEDLFFCLFNSMLVNNRVLEGALHFFALGVSDLSYASVLSSICCIYCCVFYC